MFKKRFITTSVIGCIFATYLSAYTLQDSVIETLRTNPVVNERLKNFRATQQDLNIAESGYYPQVDLSASFGNNIAGNIKDDGDSDFNHAVKDVTYNNYESSLTITQNLFNGFSTINNVDYEKARILAAAYKYLEKSNDMAFQMTSVYINVLKTNELVGTARENVQINESIYEKVKDLFEAGLTTDSEVKKIQSALSLARSNLTVQKNNALEAEFKYRRVLGRLPEVNEMEKPELDIKMPQSIERAALYAIENNPSLLVSRYNIAGAQALWKQQKNGYYPKLDLEVSQTFNDHDELGNGFDQSDDRFQARIVLTYNLFSGGKDRANVQKHVSKISQEIEIKRDLKRQVIEGLDLSWSAYDMIGEQLKDLREYSQYSEKTLELYKEEYDLGRRSLLDLLSAQNDVINSRSQIISAEYDHLFAKYRILDAMGLLVVAINGTADEFTSKVNLYTDDDSKEILDTVAVELDVDKDNIADSIDLCDNSLKENNIMPYGCKKIKLDDDKDGVINDKDQCPNTPIGVKVASNGCKLKVAKQLEEDVKLDSDNDGIEDSLDKCPNTPKDYKVDENGCTNLVRLFIDFKKDSAELSNKLDTQIKDFADFMKKSPQYKADIVGYTSREPLSDAVYNLELSKKRANRVKTELLRYEIDEGRLNADGRGFDNPIADNSTKEGRVKNRRVEVELINETKDGMK